MGPINQCGGKGAIVTGPDGECMGPAGHEATNLTEVAGGAQAATDDDEDVFGEVFNIFEDVGREDDGSARVP